MYSDDDLSWSSPTCVAWLVSWNKDIAVTCSIDHHCLLSRGYPMYIVDLGKSHVFIAGSWGIFAHSRWLQPKGAHGWLRSSEYWWTFERQGWDPRCRFVWGWYFLSNEPTYFAFIMPCMADIETNINQPKLANPNYDLLSPNMPWTSSADRSRCPMLF